ncbi:MAG: PAS domain S-box protein [Syntrophales bacterium]|jgi:PAS domain S-box-containing protein
MTTTIKNNILLKKTRASKSASASHKISGEGTHAQEPLQGDLYRTLADSSQVGVYIIQDKRFQFVNSRIQEYSGYNASEMLCKDPLSIIHPLDRQAAVKNACSMLMGKRASPYEFRIITKKGKIKWIMETVISITYNGKRAVLGSSMDVTEQKQAREQLEELAALESSILDAIPQAVVGLQNRRIIFANNAVHKIFGWKREELIGRNVEIFYRSRKESEEIARRFYSTLENQRTFTSEFYCRRKDGRDIQCIMSAARIGDRLKEKRIVITYVDITEQKQAEEELERSREQLRNLSIYLQSVREKESTRIAREIHDELGQSLTALQMDLSWLGSQLPADAAHLQDKADRMSHLVDTTIDMVHRISTELRPILLDELGLSAAIEWQAKEFQNRSGIRCDLHLDDMDSSIDKDLVTTLFRIFQETLTNIARHAGAKTVKVQLIQDGKELSLKVSDNGRGITQKQIDDPKSFGIIGIRERVNLWGGSVRITGKKDMGTKVMVRIPLYGGDA